VDKLPMPGLIGHATNVIEHPELTADAIERFAKLAECENAIAGMAYRLRRPNLPAACFGYAEDAGAERCADDEAPPAVGGPA
jgi:hypothetical protein